MSSIDDPVLRLPPLQNWSDQTLAYGFVLDRTLAVDYSGNLAPGQSGRGGIATPLPDDIHLLNLNPQHLTQSEPKATVIQKTQGGGKFIESRGDIEKSVSIAGTTGWLPPVAPHATHLNPRLNPGSVFRSDLTADQLNELAQSSGFYEFHRLRRLFRAFGQERRAGKNVHMHWLNFKDDEFWIIEPLKFTLTRTRLGYSYQIEFECIEPSEKPLLAFAAEETIYSVNGSSDKKLMYPYHAVAAPSPGRYGLVNGVPLNTPLDPPARSALRRMVQLSDAAANFVKRFAIGVVAIKMQEILTHVGTLQNVFANIAAVRRALLDMPLTIMRQIASALTGLRDAVNDMSPGAAREDVNEWLVEMTFVVNSFISYYGVRLNTPSLGQQMLKENEKFTTQRGRNGTRSSLLTEASPSAGSPTVNPFIGGAGFELIGNVQQMAAITALQPEDVLTGESIFDVAQRVLGDVHQFVVLVILNNLQPPYIVSDAVDKPPGTIAWGEQVLVPVAGADTLTSSVPVDVAVPAFSGTATGGSLTTVTDADVSPTWRDDQWVGFTVEVTSGPNLGEKRVVVSNTATALTVNRAFGSSITVGTTYKVYLEVFSRRRPVTPETRAYGRDMLAVFTTHDGVITDGGLDIMWGPNNDLAIVEGEENLKQAVALRMQTPQGSNKLHPRFGVPDLVGSRMSNPNLLALHFFYVRQSLLADPRVAAVERPSVTVENGVMSHEVSIRPVRAQRSITIRIAS